MSWVAVGIAGAGLTSSIVGGLTQDSPPGPRRAARLGAQGAVQGYAQTAPLSLALNQAYQPAYLGLGGQNLQQLLFGIPSTGGTQTVGWGPRGKYSSTINVPGGGSPGLLETLGRTAPELQRLYQEGAARGVESNVDLLNRYLPFAQQFNTASNPELAGLRRSLTNTANTNLSLGGQIAPEDLYRITQNVRGDWASRGLGRSAPAQLGEALQLYGAGEALRNQRVSQSGNLFNLLAGNEPDYARFILGLGGNPVGNALQLVGGQQPTAYQRWYDPFNPTAGSLSNTGINAQQQYQEGQANMWGGLGGGLISLGGSLYRGNNAVPTTYYGQAGVAAQNAETVGGTGLWG